jgi:hypothetical protein
MEAPFHMVMVFANPTTSNYNASVVKIYNASVVKIYNATNSLARF